MEAVTCPDKVCVCARCSLSLSRSLSLLPLSLCLYVQRDSLRRHHLTTGKEAVVWDIYFKKQFM
eukprot:JP437436.1.p4 GENE.JP437436.1~~JP437436.1.p4  ORF type:complete len:64 (+),score=2.04 JP437436.1:335-526(+)